MVIKRWTGDLLASQEGGLPTGLRFRKGAQVSIVSKGKARCGKEDFAANWMGPSGYIGVTRNNAFVPESNIGAIVLRGGSGHFELGGGVLDWSVGFGVSEEFEPGPYELTFVYNDVPGKYSNNEGHFLIDMKYDTDDLA